MEALRVCSTCGEPKSHNQFWRNPGRRDGLMAECKACMAERNARWRAENSTPEFRAKKVDWVKRSRRRDPVGLMLRSARARARQRGIEFSITRDDVPCPTHCPVLGMELIYGGSGRLGGMPASASLDRVDNTKGYVPGNVAIISDRANRLKGNATADELEAIARWMRGD